MEIGDSGIGYLFFDLEDGSFCLGGVPSCEEDVRFCFGELETRLEAKAVIASLTLAIHHPLRFAD